ncbi:transposase [Nostoc sp. WHI]|uniref:transposase n=1 Tax=Nostoc sp. WHI TaxID=2650611 RepID=UPI0018C60ADA|nr:hypothetical protein [Nostoc sp. WHI]
MSRLFARAVNGERAVGNIPGTKGGNVSLIGALNLDGLVAAMTIPGSTNTDVFLTYVTEILMPQLWKGAIVVMDNLPVHHAERVSFAFFSTRPFSTRRSANGKLRAARSANVALANRSVWGFEPTELVKPEFRILTPEFFFINYLTLNILWLHFNSDKFEFRQGKE